MSQKSCAVLPCSWKGTWKGRTGSAAGQVTGTPQSSLVDVINENRRVWAEKYVWKVVCSVSLRRSKAFRFHPRVTCQVPTLLQHCWGELNCC